MLMPARVDPTFTLEHTKSVAASASGMESMRLLSARDAPLCTRAEKPPTKSTPTTLRGLVHGHGDGRQVAGVGCRADLGDGRHGDALVHDGNAVLALELFGGGNELLGCRWSCGRRPCAPSCRCPNRCILRRFSPSVIVRMSRCSLFTIARVSAISAGVICIDALPLANGRFELRVGC